MNIEVTSQDYTCNGLGFNSWNYNKNVLPKISRWLLEVYQLNSKATIDESKTLQKK